ncbi:transcription factor Tfb4 [Dacryopinax primogenitus]|uniref:General transcription and DNA repair factor IIH subunit TFB4 n=1 Tax=Dacryopinax primogenitus (strain DJM 731) TaxID=1858805 RepID=M5GFF8_DACPD|nr:transcription factor Tfb4 [Dacryopinax primogenitus]EJU04108.1 transcription factor Tfb4 [Dacryopinax primogenitus]
MSSPSHLSLILDLTPVPWDALSHSTPPLRLKDFLAQALVFINAHLALRNENSVSVFGALPGRSMILYPPAGSTQVEADENTFHVFGQVDEGFMRSVEQEVEDLQEVEEDVPPALVGALTKSLCYINRLSNPPPPSNPSEAPPPPPHSRILLFSVSPDASVAYIPFMNCIFSAQKLKVAIDVCKLDESEVIFLHQACHLTGGAFVPITQREALLQYLSMCFLSETETRKTLAVPTLDKVDFRAACFCHKEIVDIGYVCSVCLSIFCQPVLECSTCRTKFSPDTLLRFGNMNLNGHAHTHSNGTVTA